MTTFQMPTYREWAIRYLAGKKLSKQLEQVLQEVEAKLNQRQENVSLDQPANANTILVFLGLSLNAYTTPVFRPKLQRRTSQNL